MLPLVELAVTASQPLEQIVCLDLSGIEILVVDDEADSRDFVTYVLEEAGATVIIVGSAIAALEVLSQQPLNLLISDIGMPEMDGYMLIRQFRTSPAEQSRQTPAIALTAYASEADQHQILQAGFQSHVTKPIDPVQLTAIVVSLIKT